MAEIDSSSKTGYRTLTMPNGARVGAYCIGEEYRRDVVKVERLLSLRLSCGHSVTFSEEQALPIVERGTALCHGCSLPEIKRISAETEAKAKEAGTKS